MELHATRLMLSCPPLLLPDISTKEIFIILANINYISQQIYKCTSASMLMTLCYSSLQQIGIRVSCSPDYTPDMNMLNKNKAVITHQSVLT